MSHAYLVLLFRKPTGTYQALSVFRVDGRRVVNGIIYVIKHGLQWKEAPAEHGPHGGNSAQKGDSPRLIGRTKGGLNSKLHAACDGHGRPVLFLLTEGQVRTTKVQPFSCAFFPISVRFWQTEAMTRVGCGNL